MTETFKKIEGYDYKEQIEKAIRHTGKKLKIIHTMPKPTNREEKRVWTAEAIYYKDSKSVHIIEGETDRDLYYKVLMQMYPDKFEIIKVKITRI